MTRLRLMILLGAVLVGLTGSHIAKADYVQVWVDSRGGCKPAWGGLGRIASGFDQFLDKPLSEWTDAMVDEYSQILDRCFLEVNGFRPSYNLEPRRNAQQPLATLKQALERARTAKRQKLAQMEAGGKLARESIERERAKEKEKAELETIQAQKKRELSQEESSSKQERLRAEAKRDRDAAEEAVRVAEAEAPKIAEATKLAEESRRARQVAEQKLAEVRSRIGVEEKAREDALAKAQAAEAFRRAEQQREADRTDDALLSRKCTVNLDQFKRVQLGMSLREVERIYGCKGTEVSGSRVAGYGVVTNYSWEGESFPSTATGTFQNSRLQLKAQVGLE